MTEFLIQDGTGRVYVKTDVFAARKDMQPYIWPTEDTDQVQDNKPTRGARKSKVLGSFEIPEGI